MTFFGVCYSPYHRTNEAPPNGVTEAGVEADMAIITSRGFSHIRTYGADGGNRWNVDKAAKFGLKLGLGVWVDDDPTKTNARIDLALDQTWKAVLKFNKGTVVDLVIGNEVDRTDVARYSPDQIKNAMDYAKNKVRDWVAYKPRVTTCLSGTVLQHTGSPWQKVVDNCDTVVYLTVYPWYGGAAPDNIDPQMKWSWDNGIKQVRERGKEVVIAEIGWPSYAERPDLKPATVENEKLNYAVTTKWVSGQNFLGTAFDTYWFEMFDEPWKTKEGAQGPHWGLYASGSNPQPKFDF